MSITSAGLAKLISHLLSRASWARERLSPFAGCIVRCHLEPIDLRFLIDTQGLLTAAPDAECPADVTISMPLSQLPTLVLSDTNALMNVVTLAGNAELADAVGFVFRNLEWDAEDDLAHMIGDIPAHRIALAAIALKQSHDRAIQSLTGNVAEYLTEEQNILVTHGALQAFSDELRALRDQLARLEKRTERLAKRSRTGPSHTTGR